jgi:predicted AAA+ superfamily ATPase
MRTMFDPVDPAIKWYNGEMSPHRAVFADPTDETLKLAVGDAKTIVLDEAQLIPSIGLVVKLLVDYFPDVQVALTGSSALELASGINEPMTGRKYEFALYPLSFEEMTRHTSLLAESQLMPHRMVYGYFPQVVTQPGRAEENIKELRNGYLYKDLLAYQDIRKPALLEKLVQALALQVGSDVSYLELSQHLNLDKEAVERYIDLLEKAYVLFRLPALSRNMRNEIKRSRKIYFHDVGIRNAVISNFNPMEIRGDTGYLWENFCIVERMKTLAYHRKSVNRFFWRTYTQLEIDYVEEYGGKLYGYEFKWNPKAKAKIPKAFLEAYPGSEVKVITPKNFHEFAMIQDGKK